jgi:hypothetical protein
MALPPDLPADASPGLPADLVRSAVLGTQPAYGRSFVEAAWREFDRWMQVEEYRRQAFPWQVAEATRSWRVIDVLGPLCG